MRISSLVIIFFIRMTLHPCFVSGIIRGKSMLITSGAQRVIFTLIAFNLGLDMLYRPIFLIILLPFLKIISYNL